jgi:hypothetical protein
MNGKRIQNMVLRSCFRELDYMRKKADEATNEVDKNFWIREIADTLKHLEEVSSAKPKKFIINNGQKEN